MIKKAIAYRLKADAADAQAALTVDATARHAFTEVARQWRSLAEQIERSLL